MDGSFARGPAERKRLMAMYRKHPDPEVRRRAHIVLLLLDGCSWSSIAAALYCSSRTIDRSKRRFEQGGVEALVGERRGRRSPFFAWIVALVVSWVTEHRPRDFGFLRSRWTCECLAVLLLNVASIRVSRETVRRWLHREQMVWRRPRPVLGPQDPERPAILRRLRWLLRNLPDNEIALFQDEVDVNTNPRIGVSAHHSHGRAAGARAGRDRG